MQFVAFLVGDRWYWFLLPREFYPFVDERYWVFRAHAVVGIVRDESRLLPTGMMPSVVAVHNSTSFPELYLIQEFMTRYSDFAYE